MHSVCTCGAVRCCERADPLVQRRLGRDWRTEGQTAFGQSGLVGRTGVDGRYIRIRGWARAEQHSGHRGWNNGSLVAVFDFKRPCLFNEVDLFMGFGQVLDHVAKLRFSDDGTNWCDVVTSSNSNKLDRIRLDPAANARYMQLELSEKGCAPFRPRYEIALRHRHLGCRKRVQLPWRGDAQRGVDMTI